MKGRGRNNGRRPEPLQGQFRAIQFWPCACQLCRSHGRAWKPLKNRLWWFRVVPQFSQGGSGWLPNNPRQPTVPCECLGRSSPGGKTRSSNKSDALCGLSLDMFSSGYFGEIDFTQFLRTVRSNFTSSGRSTLDTLGKVRQKKKEKRHGIHRNGWDSHDAL